MLLTVVKLSRLEGVHWAQRPVRTRLAEGLRLGILSDMRYRRVTQAVLRMLLGQTRGFEDQRDRFKHVRKVLR